MPIKLIIALTLCITACKRTPDPLFPEGVNSCEENGQQTIKEDTAVMHDVQVLRVRTSQSAMHDVLASNGMSANRLTGMTCADMGKFLADLSGKGTVQLVARPKVETMETTTKLAPQDIQFALTTSKAGNLSVHGDFMGTSTRSTESRNWLYFDTARGLLFKGNTKLAPTSK